MPNQDSYGELLQQAHQIHSDSEAICCHQGVIRNPANVGSRCTLIGRIRRPATGEAATVPSNPITDVEGKFRRHYDNLLFTVARISQWFQLLSSMRMLDHQKSSKQGCTSQWPNRVAFGRDWTQLCSE
ncbi:unnamed protein product [Caenorhabditis brenneri]